MFSYKYVTTNDFIKQLSPLLVKHFSMDSVNISRKALSTMSVKRFDNSSISESIDIKSNETKSSQNVTNSNDIIDPEQRLSSGIPTFRDFSLFVVKKILSCGSDPECLKLINVHIRPQVTRCNPCAISFDAILKVSSSVACARL